MTLREKLVKVTIKIPAKIETKKKEITVLVKHEGMSSPTKVTANILCWLIETDK